MDAQSSGPARNFSVRYVTLAFIFIFLAIMFFMLGAWYTPFHQVQHMIPENMQLKRQNDALRRQVADATTLNDLKDKQLASLKEQLSLQEAELIHVNKQLHMYKSILDKRKGKGIYVLEHSAVMANHSITWKALWVKGGSYPRYLRGSYDLFAMDSAGNKIQLNQDTMRYKIETHMLIQQTYDWDKPWVPTQLELVIYSARLKEVLRKVVAIQGQ